ncbi:sterol desaturase family protein [Novosphingobium sp. BL-8A]|uniref:sterol desaturase family protein n=1 Tax=Novosphingobium sp. BL-8A TaxID=3127639 RepID=UPI003757C3E1
MLSQWLASMTAHYQWQLSLAAGAAIFLVSVVGKRLAVLLVPTFARASSANRTAFRDKMAKAYYAKNQAWNRKWGVFFLAIIFGLIMPFCITADPQPWWQAVRDIAVILMVYDFFYYFTHRFLFHDSALLGGPLLSIHAVHHRQHNPCRMDSSYIHPVEVAIGLGLYIFTILLLSLAMGPFHIVTIVVTWIAFMEINLHNHDLWEVDRFPFRYLNTMSRMHHNHHASFNGGNFATISLFYDWLFGTLDHGQDDRAGKEPVLRGMPAAEGGSRQP